MILTREVSIRITEKNISYYEEFGYDVYIGDILTIPVEILNHGSTKKILFKCDSCSGERWIIFKNYLKYKNDNFGEYKCRLCSENRRKESLKLSHGVEYPFKNVDIIRGVIEMRKK